MKSLSICIFLFAAMLLCSSRASSDDYFPKSEAGITPEFYERVSPWYGRHLASMREPPLWEQNKDVKKSSFRFLYLPTFHAPIAIRLTATGKGEWYLITKKTDGQGGYKAGKLIVNRKRKLLKIEVDRFKKLFNELGFWDMPIEGAPEAELFIKDGSSWVFEAVQDGKYRIISRHSPKMKHWVTGEEELFAKFKQKHGLPNIDADTHFNTNEKLIALCEYLVNLSKLRPGKDIETY